MNNIYLHCPSRSKQDVLAFQNVVIACFKHHIHNYYTQPKRIMQENLSTDVEEFRWTWKLNKLIQRTRGMHVTS